LQKNFAMQKSAAFYNEQFQGKFEPGLVDELAEKGHYSLLNEGIILKGNIKILRTDEDGREILMYYLGSGESCAMSLTCCLNAKKSEVLAVAEEKTEMILLPVQHVEEWITRYPTWRSFVFQTYQRRFDDLLTTIDSVAFHKMDERLWHYLQRKAGLTATKSLGTTHEEIALELGTSREVISRLLKQLEKLGRVRLSRNRIELV
jgi:CRP/FNR family transcriptional regulator, anaerobic regulatory protein